MTLNETLLRKLAEWRPAGSGRHHLTIPLEGTGWAATVAADRCDELGCLVWDLSLRRSAAGAEGGALRDRADRAAARVTGLLEGLKVVEVDVQRDEALLRSNQPARRNDRLYYYELLLRGDREAVLRRYEASAQPGGQREQVVFAVTHEALAKVVADLIADD